MIGIIDCGGGMRGIYASGIYDYLLDHSVSIDYCLGVSAGSANLITYIAKQKGRLKRFYLQYAFEKQYMSLSNYFNKGMLFDLDYIYSGITNSAGKDPLDYGSIMASDQIFIAGTTEALSSEPRYFTKNDISFDDFTLLKASCALPLVCKKPIEFKGESHFDGGIADPIPYKKAFDDGCDKVIICLSLPVEYQKRDVPAGIVALLKKNYPNVAEKMVSSGRLYNQRIKEVTELQEQGKVQIVSPENCFGIKIATRNKEGLTKLYNLGFRDARKIEQFLG